VDEVAEPPSPSELVGATLRVGRPVADLEASCRFYLDVLGFRELFRSAGDEDRGELQVAGVGPASEPWHLELQASDRSPFRPAPIEEELLVFFVDRDRYEHLRARLADAGIPFRRPTNPFWHDDAVMVEDPDGYALLVTPR